MPSMSSPTNRQEAIRAIASTNYRLNQINFKDDVGLATDEIRAVGAGDADGSAVVGMPVHECRHACNRLDHREVMALGKLGHRLGGQ